jgi:hypothetical protein
MVLSYLSIQFFAVALSCFSFMTEIYNTNAYSIFLFMHINFEIFPDIMRENDDNYLQADDK